MITRWDGYSGRGLRFFGEISLGTKMFGCAFGGWVIFQGGCFQFMDIANQSVNLPPFGRRLPPRCLLQIVVGWFVTWDNQTGKAFRDNEER